MPTSAPGSKKRGYAPVRRSAEYGFTLVELMVVIAIIGVASAAAVLAMPDPRGRLADEASRFAVRARAAQDEAVVAARPISLWVTPAGYGFDRWGAGRWQALADKPLRVTQWSEGTSAAVPDRVRVVFDPTGVIDRAVSVPLQRERARVTVQIGTDGSVRVDG